MCLVLLKFVLLQSGLPALSPGALALPVAMPFWIAAPVADTSSRHRREMLSFNRAVPGEPHAEQLQPLQAQPRCGAMRA